MARNAGIRDMWSYTGDERKRVDLRDAGADLTTFGTEVGIGQYPVTVLDQANAMATFAQGVRAEAHFVKQVTKVGAVVHAEKLPDAGPTASSATTRSTTSPTPSSSPCPTGRTPRSPWAPGSTPPARSTTRTRGRSATPATSRWRCGPATRARSSRCGSRTAR
ncbi:hypothetical protein ACFQX7_00270 [Luedemannella flava]